ncbi:MAG: hypothetical protein J6O50_01030 [Ruminiclostridium sp.]|nr:hypothetical protein [Ruminiclostridium sp.]
MATSSIFASFNINDSKTAEAFVDALDQSSKEPRRKPLSPAPLHITDKDKILAFFAKDRKKPNE